ncbi:unnamed protein product, partial [Oikopleura dioica]
MEEQEEYEAWLAEQIAANEDKNEADNLGVDEDVFAEIEAMEKAMEDEANENEGDLLIDEPPEQENGTCAGTETGASDNHDFTNPFDEEETPADVENETGAKRKHSSDGASNAAKRARITADDFLPKRTKVLRVPPLECDFVRICSGEGDTRFVRKVPHYQEIVSSADIDLLGVSMFDLKMKADDLREEMQLNAMKIKTLCRYSGGKRQQSTEWTSTYRAKKYTELLSDEYINRTIIKWMKKWDPCVFNKKSERSKKKAEEKKQMTEEEKKKNRFKKAWSENLAEEVDEEDPLGRPKMKVLMLCGAPGLGKTTLAFVAAKHCGYNSVEINASDDRAGTEFKRKVDDALTNSSATNKKPSCLILDEIDDLLFAFATNPYVPALRELRKEALIVNFNGIDRSKLTSRLQEVCDQNQVKPEAGTLQKLAEKSEDDIRSCINALQFLSMASEDKSVTISDLKKCSMGKDQQRTLQYALKEVLAIGRNKSGNRIQDVIDIARQYGETDKLLSNTYELCGEVRAPSSMEQLYKSREWYGWADQLTHFVQKSQNYALEAEKVYAVAGIHYNIAQNSEIEGVLKPQNVAWEMRQKQQIRENLLTGVRNGLNLKTRKSFIGFELVNALSNVLSMLEPNIRSVNPSLLSKTEQKALQQCVGTFVDFGLSLKNVKNEETMTYNMVVEPPLKIITGFPDECKMAKRGLTQQTKLLISSEIEREKVRRIQQNMNRGNNNKTLKDISNTGTPKKSSKKNECLPLQAV